MSKNKFFLGTLSGNAMEFYDFTIYAFMASYISKEFFDASNSYISNIITFCVFASGYLVRPIGSIFFGYIGDKLGRDTALSSSLLLASIATLLIGLSPGYKSIGMVAPVLLVVFRLIQGFAVSGEEGGTAVRLYESKCFKGASYIGSSVLASVFIGVVFATVICSSVLFLIEKQVLPDFSWRIPFIISFPLGVLSMYLRMKNIKGNNEAIDSNSGCYFKASQALRAPHQKITSCIFSVQYRLMVS